MKKYYTLLTVCIMIHTIACATNKYWVGPLYGNWNNSANWSKTSGGAGGAGVPGITDDIIFDQTAKLKMDASPAINSLRTSLGNINVTLFTNVATTLTVISSLTIAPYSSLKDSTSASVPFDVYFTNSARGYILGDWIFEGSVPLSGAGNPGASFIAPAGSLVKVDSVFTFSARGGRIICNNYSKPIQSTNATLKFGYSTYFISDNILDATIPFATWAEDSLSSFSSYAGTLGAPASTILLLHNLEHLKHLGGVPVYGRMVVDLSTLTTDVSLALPNRAQVRGNLEVLNTNKHTVTLMAPSSFFNSQVDIGTDEAGRSFGGNLNISGSLTKVALAKANQFAPFASYSLMVHKSFNQSGGNFSLQDYDLATGTTTLSIKNDLIETGGSFFTNSTSTSAGTKFRVIMDDPIYHAGPSGSFYSSRIISMSGGTIDNGRNIVSLRINHTVYSLSGYPQYLNGVILQSPLTVGRLELVSSPLTTSNINMLTVSNPGSDAITVGNNTSYVNGPLRRATNSTQPYCFPTGKGNNAVGGYFFDSCIVTPVSTAPSVYQAEYYNTGFPAYTSTLPLRGVSPSEFWYIFRIGGSSDASVKLVLHGAVPGASLFNSIVVAYFNYPTGNWINENGTTLRPGTSSTGAVTSKPLLPYGYYTFGYIDPFIPPIIIPHLSSSPVNTNNIANDASTASSNQKNSLWNGDIKTMKPPAIYPNPFVDNFTIDFNNPLGNTVKANVGIYDATGNLLFTQQIKNIVAGENSVRINLAGRKLPVAIYIARLSINGMAATSVQLMKNK